MEDGKLVLVEWTGLFAQTSNAPDYKPEESESHSCLVHHPIHQVYLPHKKCLMARIWSGLTSRLASCRARIWLFLKGPV